MYRTRRQNRFEVLADAHFLPFEQSALSHISPRVPYMKPLIKKRIEDYNKFIAGGGSDKQFAATIRKQYRDNKWRRLGEGWTQTVAFRMLKAVEKQWKYKHPAYESPWMKRRKDWTGFSAKLDATYERYPRGRTYSKKKPPVKLEYLPTGGARIIG